MEGRGDGDGCEKWGNGRLVIYLSDQAENNGSLLIRLHEKKLNYSILFPCGKEFHINKI